MLAFKIPIYSGFSGFSSIVVDNYIFLFNSYEEEVAKIFIISDWFCYRGG